MNANFAPNEGSLTSMDWLDTDFVRLPYMILCRTPEAFDEVQDHLNVDRMRREPFLCSVSADATTHFFVDDNKTTCVVCLPDTNRKGKEQTPIQIAAMLAHEAVHIWQEYERKLSRDDLEFEAYTIQIITQRLLESYAFQKFGVQ